MKRVSGKVWIPGMLLALILLATVFACAAPTPTATPAPKTAPPTAASTPTPASTPKATATPSPSALTAVKPVTLRVASYGPERAATKGAQWWTDEVQKRTNGQIKFQWFHNETLVPSKEMPDALKSKAVDMAFLTSSYYPGKYPLYGWNQLPAFIADPLVMAKVSFEAGWENKALKDEDAQWNAKFLFVNFLHQEYMGKKPVKSVADFKGLRIRAVGDYAKLAQGLGAVPVSMAAPEAYEALQRGMLDGVSFAYTYMMGSYGIHEQAKYASIAGFGAGAAAWAIRLDLWNEFPPDVQKMMYDLAGQTINVYNDIFTAEDRDWEDKFKKAGVETYQFTADQKKEVAKAGAVAVEGWVKGLEAKGLPARDLVSYLQKLSAKYEK